MYQEYIFINNRQMMLLYHLQTMNHVYINNFSE